ncbi:unnamed protein product [Didymodactylos carnosus]|uniref:NAD(P)(+)--arginine ADP-ribosyltransferase n=1 Tax=Didymodactylos carnosus TaxID=1234261 RepID=A0A8S2K5C4_9BILA|nr:unnamed protein product [Didymodactylos carnosus]CAF3838258.1 unnamed protein product [Didymodactylos carnosus]
MQFNSGPSLYVILNETLRAENRDNLKAWFLFLKLFLFALEKLPSVAQPVYRGVKDVDLSDKYINGEKFVWWGVSSCTLNIEVLQSEQFLGKFGKRTLFSIDSKNSKSIIAHSYYKKLEKEVILMPGTYLEVVGKIDANNGLHIIQLKEIEPPIKFVKPANKIQMAESTQLIQNMKLMEKNPVQGYMALERKLNEKVQDVQNDFNQHIDELASTILSKRPQPGEWDYENKKRRYIQLLASLSSEILKNPSWSSRDPLENWLRKCCRKWVSVALSSKDIQKMAIGTVFWDG